MTSRILNRFNIKTDRLLRSLATDELSCDIHPVTRKMIKMVRRVSRDHIIINYNILLGAFVSRISVNIGSVNAVGINFMLPPFLFFNILSVDTKMKWDEKYRSTHRYLIR